MISSRYRLPPPYVPPEIAKLKRSEMPPEYRAQIDTWIARETRHREAVLHQAKLRLIALATVTFVFAVAIITLLLLAK